MKARRSPAIILKRVTAAFWACCIVFCIFLYFSQPDNFTPSHIADLLLRYKGIALLLYAAVSTIRGFTLLPSTPLVIAGTLIFPRDPYLVLAVSIGGILLSSTMIYFFSDWLGFRDFFDTKRAQLTERIRTQLEKPAGVFFVFFWSFFPLVPTDAVCYVAGTSRMAFRKFILAVFLGEMILCSFYIFFGGFLFRSLY